MTSVCNLEKQKIRPLVSLFLKTGANFEEKFPKQYVRPMKLFMLENVPFITLSDGFYYIEAHFTKECINDFRKNYSHLKFNKLRARILFVQKWSLELRHCNSRKEYNSHRNLQVFLVVEQFRAISHEVINDRQMKSNQKLYCEPGIKTFLENHRDKFVRKLFEQKMKSMAEYSDPLAMGTFKMPSLKAVC